MQAGSSAKDRLCGAIVFRQPVFMGGDAFGIWDPVFTSAGSATFSTPKMDPNGATWSNTEFGLTPMLAHRGLFSVHPEMANLPDFGVTRKI
jgi:hypothetical protein